MRSSRFQRQSRIERSEFRGPVEVLDGPLQLAFVEQRDGQVLVRAGVVLVEPDGDAQVLDPLRVLAEMRQQQAGG